jgi:hypothetical protein
MTHVFSPSSLEIKAGGSLWEGFQGSQGYTKKPCLKKKGKKINQVRWLIGQEQSLTALPKVLSYKVAHNEI